MESNDQSFFTVLRDLARKLDNLPNCADILSKSEKKLQSLKYMKDLSQNLNNNILESKKLKEDLQNSYATFRSITDFTSLILEQQKTIIESQESFLEEHGYIPYRLKKSTPAKTKVKPEDPSDKEEELNTPPPPPSENGTNKDETDEKESPQTPQLKDFGLSYYTIAQLQKPNSVANNHNGYYCSNYTSNYNNCVSTPASYTHNGLIMSPGVLGRISPLFTPVAAFKNGTQMYKTPNYFESTTYSSQKLVPETETLHNRHICKKLEIQMNEEELSTRKQSLESQQLDSDVYLLHPTPQLGKRKPLINYSKDNTIDEIPKPPKLSTPIVPSHLPKSSHRNKSVDLQTEVLVPEVNMPSPPLLHMADTLLCKNSTSFLSNTSVFFESNKENIDEIEIPKPPKLNFRYDTRLSRPKKDI